MKMKKLARVFTSAVLTGAMVLTMGGMTAFAMNPGEEPNEPVVSPTTPERPGNFVTEITKIIRKRENVYAPKATFKFTASGGVEISGANLGDAAIPSITISNDGILTSVPTEETLTKPSYEVGKLAITVNGDYPAPGKYRYTITEEGAQDGNAEGIKYDVTPRNFDVIVASVNDGTKEAPNYVNKVVAATFVTEDGNSKDWGKIWNGYGFEPGSENPEPNTDVNDLTITKVVAGNQGNKSEDFTFSIKVTDEDNNSEQYYVMYNESNATKRENFTLKSGETDKTVTLKHGESVTITGLSNSDKYEVTEMLNSAEGYTTTVQINSGDVVTALGTTERTMGATNTTVTVTNTKDVTTPTGIVLSFAPYILLVALAGVFGVLFLRRKKEEF